MDGMDYRLGQDQLKILANAHDALHDDIIRKSEEAAERKALQVIDEFRDDLTKVSTAADKIDDIHNAIITGIDGAPGVLENQRKFAETQEKQQKEIDVMKASQIQWKPLFKGASLIAGGAGALLALFVLFTKASAWVSKYFLAFVPLVFL
jgi:hypothetical protein